MEVRARVYARCCGSFGVDGVETVFPLLVSEVHRSFIGEEQSVAPIAGGHHAVEHVDPSLNALQQVLRCAYAHEVSWPVFGQDVVHHLYHLVHHLCGFTHGQPSDGIAFGAFVRHILGCLLSEVFVGASLHDGEEGLPVSVEWFSLVESLDAPVQPPLGEHQRVACILVVALSRRTFVECHHDVCPYGALCVHDILWGEDVLRAVDV